MSTAERLLSLAARLPAAMLPFAVAVGLAEAAIAAALAAAAAALCGYWAAGQLTPWLLKRLAARHLMLCAAVLYVVLSVVLIVAVEQHALWWAGALSAAAGASAPAERTLIRHRRLERTAFGVGMVIAVICAVLSAWTIPLVAAAFIAATAVPVLVMKRTQPPRNSTTAFL